MDPFTSSPILHSLSEPFSRHQLTLHPQFGWGPVCWIYASEIPAARLRSMTVALAAATQWLFNCGGARATPNMLTTMGRAGYGCFLFYGSCCFSMFIFVWFLIPETKGLSLERMDDLFGVTELVKHVEEEGHAHGHGETGTGVEKPAAEIQEVVAEQHRFQRT